MRLVIALALAACGCAVVTKGLEQGLSTLGKANEARVMLAEVADVSKGPNPLCYWDLGLSCGLDELDTNVKLGEADRCDLAVPVPIDNYVADLRGNKFDDKTKKVASQQPYIQIKSIRRGGTTTSSTKKSSWYQYVANATLVQNEIVFDTPGVYDLEIVANDYIYQTSCVGCVAIIDEFRPRYGYSGKCPKQITTPQTLTKDSLAAFQNYDSAYRKYTSDSNVLNNPWGVLCAAPGDTDNLSKSKLFYESEKDYTSTCFDNTALTSNIWKLKTSPLAGSLLQLPYTTLESTLNSQCQWCCRKTRRLKEMFTPYTCPTDYEKDPGIPTPRCVMGSNIPNTCSIDGCLQAKGTDIVTASVVMKTTVQTASLGLLNALPNKPTGCDSTKHIYYSIPCTSFDKTNVNCRYPVKLSLLLDVTMAFKADFPAPSSELTKAKDYIFWRYSTDDTAFVAWDPTDDAPIVFTNPTTTVALEAWTACGRVYTTTFTVNLFLHSTLSCTKFPAMWKVIEKPGVQGTGGAYCAYGGSGFGILKLDMTVADILQQVNSTVAGTYTGIQCDIVVKPAGATSTQSVTIVDDKTSTTIQRFYGVERVNSLTSEKTTGVVHCKLTRTPRTNAVVGASAAVADAIDCSYTFTLMNCDCPELLQGDVCANKCVGNSAPGAFEACGGSIVKYSATGTVIKPSLAQTCCSKCAKTLTCANVGTSDIKRCEPPSTTKLLAQLIDTDDTEYQSITNMTASTMLMALLGGSAIVLVVAFAIAMRRGDTNTCADADQDTYYSLVD